MEALWIAAALVVAVMGGWPVTAGILKLARSKTVRAADAAEADGQAPADLDGTDPVSAAETLPVGDPDTEASPETASEAALESATPSAPKTEVLRGGLLIGCLERAAVAVAILSGQPVAIAYVVAIKGLGRYPELKDTPAASERFIIGTLASMLWAASVAVLTKALLL
ncbi:hypothetical protein AS189_15275 [Arthrobacter alpinus]|uniref:Uncharacterized protein n=1 Tax=Arthrobacter alpinus TaxID=656366 RepID=A0A0S2M1K7_9MICC|nr:hypothetical protein [Arthrobacter alpinus]ALO67602.1 hypothetical protein AS189_15275 [Arthrobacter alpinus]